MSSPDRPSSWPARGRGGCPPCWRRRALATHLGATPAVDPKAGPLSEQIKEINPGGADYAIDTTAVTPVVEQLLASLGMRGMLGLIGVPAAPPAVFSVGLFQPPLLGLTIR